MTDNLRDNHMSDLRNRVAMVLARLYEPKCCDECDQHRDSVLASFYLEDADVLIEELGMRQLSDTETT